MLDDYQKIQPEVQKEIQVQLEKFFAQKQNEQQFQLSKIQNHVHSGSDAPNIPPSSITSFIAIPGTTGGVFAPEVLGSQAVNAQGITSNVPIPFTVYVAQLPIIYGNGVGAASAFNGGTAQEGTMLLFNNGATNQLWIYADAAWRGVNLPLT